MASYMYGWMDKKGRNEFESITWRERKVWIRGKTGHWCQKAVAPYQKHP